MLPEFDEANLVFSEVDCVKLKHGIVALLVVTLFACILGAGYIDTFYLPAMPRTPQPDTGKIYPVQWKSISVSVNREALNRASLAHKTLPIVGLCCFLGLVAIEQYWEK
jgi:hypothetical protein